MESRRAGARRAPRQERVPFRRKLIAWIFVGLMVMSVFAALAYTIW